LTSTNRHKHPTSPHFHCWLSVDHILGRHRGSYSTFLFLALQSHAEQSRHSNCYSIAFFSSTLSSTCLPLYTRWTVPLSALYLTSTSPAGHAPRRPRDLPYDTSSQARNNVQCHVGKGYPGNVQKVHVCGSSRCRILTSNVSFSRSTKFLSMMRDSRPTRHSCQFNNILPFACHFFLRILLFRAP